MEVIVCLTDWSPADRQGLWLWDSLAYWAAFMELHLFQCFLLHCFVFTVWCKKVSRTFFILLSHWCLTSRFYKPDKDHDMSCLGNLTDWLSNFVVKWIFHNIFFLSCVETLLALNYHIKLKIKLSVLSRKSYDTYAVENTQTLYLDLSLSGL